MASNGWSWWGAVEKEGGSIRCVGFFKDKEMATDLLTENWTDALKALYDIKPVTVAVAE